MFYRSLRFWALLAAVAAAQPGPSNTDPSCTGVTQLSGDTIYYSTLSTDDFGNLAEFNGCSPGSYAQVRLQTPSGSTVNCGYIALDGLFHLTSCPDYPRGSSAAGAYEFLFDVGIFQGYIPFTVVHTQQTYTTTATVTDTYSSFDSTTLTTIVTNTDTTTSSQLTVTSPSSTMTNTVLITPTPTKTTVTSTTTHTATVRRAVVTVVTSTITSCPASILGSVPRRISSRASERTAVPLAVRGAARLIRRDIPNAGEGILGDGPLSVTLTNVVSQLVTVTMTLTYTDTVYAPDVTTTVANPTPTTTFYTGIAVVATTSTLPQLVKTKTKHRDALTKTTVTSTHTFVVEATSGCSR